MTPKETLLAYGQQQASLEEVLRSLVSYDGWLVKDSLAAHVTGRTRFARSLALGSPSNIPPDQLWYYTDEASAQQAVDKGARLGTYVGGVPGARLFAATPANFASVSVNIGCPQAETWFIPNESFAHVALWAHAIALESRLAEADSPEKLAAMRDYVGYIYFIHPQQDAIATAVGLGGLKNPALVFTAIDCAQALISKYPQLQRQIVDGRTLFSRLPAQGVDGIVFNAFGPGAQAVFDLSICERALSAPAETPGKKSVVQITLKDGLMLPSGFVHPASYACVIFCDGVPADWMQGGALKAEKLEAVFESMYGKTWRGGNSDGSQYVVQSVESRTLTPLEEQATPWHGAVNNRECHYWFYEVSEAGELQKVEKLDR
jgi:hypothetical protein